MKKKISGIAIILCVVLAGFYIYNNYTPAILEIDKVKLPSLPENREECLAQGGKWGRIGLSEFEKCNLKTSDLGKKCTDSSQCQGSCLGEGTFSRAGKCSEWRITVGCHYFVSDGNVEGQLCAD